MPHFSDVVSGNEKRESLSENFPSRNLGPKIFNFGEVYRQN